MGFYDRIANMGFRERATEAWKRAACAVHLACLVARSWVRQWMGASPCGSKVHGPTAYRVYLFNQGTGVGFHREVAPRYFDPQTWEQDAADLTGWTDFRAEIRYILRNKKYRMVLHRGDACAFPPYQEPQAPACRLPKGVLSARLQGSLGSDIDWDVTSRVMKYQGPKGDFHAGLGLRVTLHEMFPFDDHADNSSRFTHLRMMDTMGRLHDVSYTSNRSMTLIKGP